jgi:hypothetical protein
MPRPINSPSSSLVKLANYEAPYYAVFSSLPPLSPSYVEIFLSTLFSNTLNLCASLSARDQVSHPYKTTGKIVLYILIFKFLGAETGRQGSELNSNILDWLVF